MHCHVLGLVALDFVLWVVFSELASVALKLEAFSVRHRDHSPQAADPHHTVSVQHKVKARNLTVPGLLSLVRVNLTSFALRGQDLNL